MNHRPTWADASPLTRAYFDTEWGKKTRDETAVFEALSLLVFQAGLTWHTVLKHREELRRAFVGFDPSLVAELPPGPTLRQCPIRNLRKVSAVITNAQAATALADTGGLSEMVWNNTYEGCAGLAKNLKRAGFTSVGPRTALALLETVGAVG